MTLMPGSKIILLLLAKDLKPRRLMFLRYNDGFLNTLFYNNFLSASFAASCSAFFLLFPEPFPMTSSSMHALV
jgi:hypothetical protein